MAIDFNSQKSAGRKYPKLLIIIAVILLLSGAVLAWLLMKPKTESQTSETSVVAFKRFNINFDILKDPFFAELKTFDKAPDYNGAVGRGNPFQPF